MAHVAQVSEDIGRRRSDVADVVAGEDQAGRLQTIAARRRRVPTFGRLRQRAVVGVPTGGIRLARGEVAALLIGDGMPQRRRRQWGAVLAAEASSGRVARQEVLVLDRALES